MKRGFKLQNYPTTKLQNRERGYILITLMLFVALLSIAALAVLPEIKQRIRRDREEELQHRGTAYMRAIQHFYKKNGRYPARIEDLEKTNNIRFLRKRYKDPITGKDFKLLHIGDKELNVLGGGIGIGGQIPGLAPGQPLGPGQAQSQFQTQFGGAAVQTAVTRQPGGPQPAGVAQAGSDSGTAATGDANDSNESNPANQGTAGAPGSGSPQSNSPTGNNPQVFGGGAILGVTSTNKDKSIREFGDKIKHYNEWLFVYDPTADRGGLLRGPVVPNALNGGGMGTPASAVANRSQGGASSNHRQNPSPLQQGPPNPQQEPPEE